jgi:simple sugar transport system permease protein
LAKVFERRLAPADSSAAIAGLTIAAFFAAMAVGTILFVVYHANPLTAYLALFREPFATLRGFGYALVRASPLALISLGTIVSWRSGFAYLGFEGCFVIGAAAAAWLALETAQGSRIGPLPFALFLPVAICAAFTAGGIWSGIVGILRARFGGNEVLISLMANYVAIFFLQYLVSGPMRAPGTNPETPLLPRATWLPFILPGTRAHAGILLAIAAAILVAALLQKTSIGYDLIVTGFNARAARYAGIPISRDTILAAFIAGGFGGLAGLAEVLGSQHRLMEGIGGGIGFLGIIVALLARLNPIAVVPTAILYGGMSVGADAMQRRAAIPSSITFILESLIVLFALAFDALRFYRINFSAGRATPSAPHQPPEAPE